MLNIVSAYIRTSYLLTSTNRFAISSHPLSTLPPTFYNNTNISSPNLHTSHVHHLPQLLREPHFLSSISEKSAYSCIKQHCSNYLWMELHHKNYNTAPKHLHFLPSLLSPQTSYPLISLCCSQPSHRLPPWIFIPACKHTLCLPLFDPTDKPIGPCGCRLDPFGDHIFQCRQNRGS